MLSISPTIPLDGGSNDGGVFGTISDGVRTAMSQRWGGDSGHRTGMNVRCFDCGARVNQIEGLKLLCTVVNNRIARLNKHESKTWQKTNALRLSLQLVARLPGRISRIRPSSLSKLPRIIANASCCRNGIVLLTFLKSSSPHTTPPVSHR